ncbi:hypothetical protein [Nonomuraea typhae]|uniref:hypothetical protein n=1 Tax=Nonomuraea typhae TaxID=2603600 RepID=UPI0012F911B1|nr:hypothetical protein [Nonomuraea typhae]
MWKIARRGIPKPVEEPTLKKVPRDGYADVDEAGIADPAPLVEKGAATPRRYAGAQVVNARALLPVAALGKAGLRLQPNPLPGVVKRNYFDGRGTGPVDRASDLFLASTPPNACQYVVRPRGSVDVEVYQPAYANPGAMRYEFSDWKPRAPIGRVRVTGRDKGDSFTLRLGNVPAVVRANLPGRAKAIRPLLRTVAANLEAGRAGLPGLGFSSPLMPAAPVFACRLYGPEEFRSVYGKAASPYVEEEIGTAVGVIDYSIGTAIADRREYAYTGTTCRRVTIQEDAYDQLVLKLEVDSYQSPKAPEHAMAFGAGVDGGRPVAGVGAGAYCVTRKYARSAGALVFRQGRFLATLTMYATKQVSAVNAQASCARLAPVARKVAGRLRLTGPPNGAGDRGRPGGRVSR